MAVGNPTLFLKAHWIFSTATCLPNKHNLSFNTSSIQRVFLISAKPPSPRPEYKLSVWALWLKKGRRVSSNWKNADHWNWRHPTRCYSSVKRSNARRKGRGCKGGEGRKWAGRAPAKYRQRLFFEKYLCGKDSSLHTQKRKKTGKKSFPIQVQLLVWNIRDTEKMKAVLGGYQSMSSSANCIKRKWWKKVKFCI